MILAIGGPASKKDMEPESEAMDSTDSNCRDASKLLIRALDSKSPDAVMKALYRVFEAFGTEGPAEDVGMKEED